MKDTVATKPSRNPIATRPLYATRRFHESLLTAAGVEMPDLSSDPVLAALIEASSTKLPKKTSVVPGVWVWVGVIHGSQPSNYEVVTVPTIDDFADRMRDQNAEVHVHYFGGLRAEVTVFQYSASGNSRFEETVEFRRQLVTPYTGRLEASNQKVERRTLEWRSDLVNVALDKYHAEKAARAKAAKAAAPSEVTPTPAPIRTNGELVGAVA